jgi:hypothetical protein
MKRRTIQKLLAISLVIMLLALTQIGGWVAHNQTRAGANHMIQAPGLEQTVGASRWSIANSITPTPTSPTDSNSSGGEGGGG